MLLRYVLPALRLRLALVLVCILVSAVATVRGTLFLKTLIDDYIVPLLASGQAGTSAALAAAAAHAWPPSIGVGVLCRLRLQPA